MNDTHTKYVHVHVHVRHNMYDTTCTCKCLHVHVPVIMAFPSGVIATALHCILGILIRNNSLLLSECHTLTS